MEVTIKELKKSKIETFIKKSSTRDSLDFEGLDSYRKQAEENLKIQQKTLYLGESELRKPNIKNDKSYFNGNSYFKRRISSRNLPLKDQLMLSDIQKYLKFGIFPYIVIIHLSIVLLTTMIIVKSYEELSIFRSHRRNLAKIFFSRDPFDAFTKKNYPNFNILLDLYDLKENFDYVLDKVFSFETLFTHKIKVQNHTTIKFDLIYKSEFAKKSIIENRTYEILIMNKTDNFLNKKSQSEIRGFLRFLKEIRLKLKYQLKLHGDSKDLCSDWTLYFKWNIGDRGAIKFFLETIFVDCIENSFFYLIENYSDGFAVFNILLIFLAFGELVIALGRIWESYKNYRLIEFKLKNNNYSEEIKNIIEDHNKNNSDDDQNNIKSINNYSNNNNRNYFENMNNDKLNFINSKETGISIYDPNNFYRINENSSEYQNYYSHENYDHINIKNLTVKNNWDLLRFSDKRKFFNLWYVLFALGNIFQIFTGVINLIFPIFAENNMIFNSISCMLAWFAVGYFLDYQKKYSFFYKILKKSSISYLKYLFLFCIIFFSFVILGLCVYSNSYLFSGFSNAGIFFFALIFGDTMLANSTQLSYHRPYLIIILNFLFFLCFNMLCLRIFTSITEDSFDHVKMKNNYSLLEKKITLKEYLLSQVDNKNDDETDNEENASDDNSKNLEIADHTRYMVSDVFIQVLLFRENQLNQKINEYFVKNDSKLKKDLILKDEIEFDLIVKKKLKKIKKSLYSKNLMNSIIKHDEENDPLQMNLQLGKTDIHNKKLQNFFNYGELIFKCILEHFEKIGEVIHINKKNYMRNISEEEKKNILEKVFKFTDKILFRIGKFSNKHKNKVRRMNTAGNIIFTLKE